MTSGTPPEECATEDDWRRLLESLLHTDEHLGLRLAKVTDGGECARLLQQRTQLRTFYQLCKTQLEQAADQRRREGQSAPPGLRAGHTILVVDDHPPTLYVATRLLKQAGYQVMEAATGEEALLLSPQASALLLDVNLPDVNGVEVCQSIKTHSRSTPVVLMSAVYTDELHRYAGMSAGADLYLTSFLDGQLLASSFDRLLAPNP